MSWLVDLMVSMKSRCDARFCEQMIMNVNWELIFAMNLLLAPTSLEIMSAIVMRVTMVTDGLVQIMMIVLKTRPYVHLDSVSMSKVVSNVTAHKDMRPLLTEKLVKVCMKKLKWLGCHNNAISMM